jgi:hypothetical protein
MRYSEAEALAAENAERDQGPYYVICKAIPTAPAGCEYEACDPGKAWTWAQRDGWHLAAEILPKQHSAPMTRAELNRKLTGAVVRYDEAQAKKKFYNRYALAQYCEAVSNILDAVDRGAELRTAILDNVQGPLATACLRAVGLPAMRRDERR